MTDLARYGRHEEGCDFRLEKCQMCSWNATHATKHGEWSTSDPHTFTPKPCSCGFAAALAAEGWQPIATAPKDEAVRILLTGGSRREVTTGYWNQLYRRWCGDDPEDFTYSGPTHWQSIPAPPGVRHATE